MLSLMARKEKKTVYRVQITEEKRNIIHQFLEEYDIETAKDIQDASKDLLGGTTKEIIETEMEEHISYEKSERMGMMVIGTAIKENVSTAIFPFTQNAFHYLQWRRFVVGWPCVFSCFIMFLSRTFTDYGVALLFLLPFPKIQTIIIPVQKI